MKSKFLITTNFALKPDMKLAIDFEKHMGMPMDIFYKDSSGAKNNSTLLRHFSYIRTAIRAFFHRNDYDYIVFWTQFIGLYYGLISRLLFFLPNNPKTIILALMYVKRDGFAGKIYHSFFKFMLDTKAINFAVCSARSEKDYLNKVLQPKNIKILFTRYGQGESNQEINDKVDDIYFFSGGGSLRDYKTLIDAFANLKYKLKIASTPDSVKNIEIPDNVEIITDAWGEDFDNLIRYSYAVLVILKNTNASAGQLVLIRAMKNSKPVIVTAGENINDYIDPSYAIPVKLNSQKDIIQAVNKLISEQDLTDRMGKAAFENYKNTYTEDRFVYRVCEILKKTV